MRDRKVIGYTPRPDSESGVSLLVATAFDYATDGPSAEMPREIGKGWISTVDWRYRVRIA